MNEVIPGDLLQFGFIPEFVGRVPLIVGLADLNEDDLIRVLTEPKNALIRQYQALFRMDDVELEFTRNALQVTAEEAHRRGTGARALRAIVEETLIDVMYELPSMTGVRKCIIDGQTITDHSTPVLLDADGNHMSLHCNGAETPAA